MRLTESFGSGVMLLLFVLPSWSQAERPAVNQPQAVRQVGELRATDIEAGATYENLTNGRAPWRRAYLLFIKRFSTSKVVYGSVEETSRFERTDTEAAGGVHFPLSNRWNALVEASISPTHNVLSRWSFLGQVEYMFHGGWGAHAGFRHRQYNAASVNTASLTLEKYITSFRFSYTAYVFHLQNAGLSVTHRADANHYYGQSALNLTLAYGRELENILPAGILRTDVRLVSVGGTHWFTPGWAVSYNGTWHEQGRHYARHGLTLGVRRRL